MSQRMTGMVARGGAGVGSRLRVGGRDCSEHCDRKASPITKCVVTLAMDSKLPQKHRVYLDKGTLGYLNLMGLSGKFDVCYSEALLLDLKSDSSDQKYCELDELSSASGLYLKFDQGRVEGRLTNAREAFSRVSTFEVDFMFQIYQFLH
jgi:hypothetical protein